MRARRGRAVAAGVALSAAAALAGLAFVVLRGPAEPAGEPGITMTSAPHGAEGSPAPAPAGSTTAPAESSDSSDPAGSAAQGPPAPPDSAAQGPSDSTVQAPSGAEPAPEVVAPPPQVLPTPSSPDDPDNDAADVNEAEDFDGD